MLFAKMIVKKTQTPTQNVQMMTAEPRNKEPSVNIVTISGITISANQAEGKKPLAYVWVQKAPEKKEGVNLQRENDTFTEAKKNLYGPWCVDIKSTK